MSPIVSSPVSARVNFFSASTKDLESRVTFKLSDIQSEFSKVGIYPKLGDNFLITLRHKNVPYQVHFRVNREDQTLKTTSWPQGLPQLQIGLTFHADVEHVISLPTTCISRTTVTTSFTDKENV